MKRVQHEKPDIDIRGEQIGSHEERYFGGVHQLKICHEYD